MFPLMRVVVLVSVILWVAMIFLIGGSGGFNRQTQNSSQSFPGFFQRYCDCVAEVTSNLPITPSGDLAVHHFFGKNKKLWNAGIRLAPIPSIGEAPVMVTLGGHRRGEDSMKFLRKYKNLQLHIFEPVKEFFNELKQVYSKFPQVKTYNLGVGNESKTVMIDSSLLQEQGSFVMEGVSNNHPKKTMIPLYMIDAGELLQTIGMGNKEVDLLHINCEGCEWELFDRFLQLDMLHKFRVIQISFHNYGSDNVGNRVNKYCNIRLGLENTHRKIAAIPFGWERWVRYDAQNPKVEQAKKVESKPKERIIRISNSLIDLTVTKEIRVHRGYCLLSAWFGRKVVDNEIDPRVNVITSDNSVCDLKIQTPFYKKHKNMYCAKLVKANVHKFCDRVIWLDIRYRLVPPDVAVDVFGGHSLVLHKHMFCKSVAEEFKAARVQPRYQGVNLDEQFSVYKTKFDVGKTREHFAMGMFSVDLTRGEGDAIKHLLEEWWWHNYLLSFEDQISFPLVLELHKIHDVKVLGDGKNNPCALLKFPNCYKQKGYIVDNR